ncbi:squalene/phytoene synthase family protein [Parasulfitobacter algicola]|uniref:Squalene/phytoene synthase family protein n=1 Tax=Parasulfitobacter algicola TaxID=2614809 RepID=A0ABX2IRC2_9RHOB|nr:squalene/phytoene synthase family protein [Sulfitobacter algicola]NSX55428.1 squalene/phytoene synthase family protein [Sulfitobacter algicola]
MSLDACAALVEKADPDRFLAAMSAPVEARRVLFPIYAFNVEVSRAPWVTEEPMIAEMRLQWWRDALEEIAQAGPVRRHEVVDALAAVLDKTGAQLLDKLVAIRRWDIYKDVFEDTAHFEDYIQTTSGNLMWAAVRALGNANEAVVRDFAYGVGIANWFCAIPKLEGRGRKPLLDGRAEAVKALGEQALHRLLQARSRRAEISPAAASALRAGWRAKAILSTAIKAPERVADGNLTESAFISKIRLMGYALTNRW